MSLHTSPYTKPLNNALVARLGSAFTELTTWDYKALFDKEQGEFEAYDCVVFERWKISVRIE